MLLHGACAAVQRGAKPAWSGLSSAEFEGSQLGSRPTSAEGQGPASPLA